MRSVVDQDHAVLERWPDMADAKAMVQAHDDGREFQVGLWTGASTAPDADGAGSV
jgi:hypothetical protein